MRQDQRIDIVVGIALVALLLAVGHVASGAQLAAARDTPTRPGVLTALVQGSNTIYRGAMVAVDANGLAVAASDTAAIAVIGRAERTQDNTGTAYSATRTLNVRRGVFCWDNDGSFTAAHIGQFAYVADDSGVTTAVAASNDIVAGLIVDVDSDGVWIDTFAVPAQGASSLAALTVTGAASVGTTLAVTGVATFTAESVHNGGIDTDYVTTDADAGVDTKTAGTLLVGAATATKIELADTGVETEIQGTLDVQEAAQIKVMHTTVLAATNLTLTAAHYGSTVVVTTNAAVAVTLPANGAGAGSWIDVLVAGTDDCAPTIAAATTDTLRGPDDADLKSVTWGTGHRIGAYARFISDGSYWTVLNLGGTTMTYTD
jgi:hypothetical protein